METLHQILSPDFLLRNSVYTSVLIGLACPLVGVFLVFFLRAQTRSRQRRRALSRFCHFFNKNNRSEIGTAARARCGRTQIAALRA